jgi:hypothetical protein
MQLTAAMVMLGFALPAVLVAGGLILAWRAWRGACSCDARWIAGPLIAAGLVIAFPSIEQTRPPWPPGSGNAVFWIFYCALALGLLTFLQDVRRPPWWLAALLLIALWRLFMRVMLAPQVPRLISDFEAEAWIDAATVAVVVSWLAMQQLARIAPGPTAILVLGIVCTGWAVMLVTWHIIRSGELAGTLAIMCAAAAVVSIWRRWITLTGGGVSAVVLLLLCLIVHGYFYTDDTFSPAQQARTVILLVAPLLAFAGDLPGIRRARPGWRLAARLAPVLLAVGIVAGLAAAEYASAQAANQAADE